MIQGRNQPAWGARGRKDHVEWQVLATVTDERIDADDRHSQCEELRADGFSRRAMIGENTGRVKAVRHLIQRGVAADPDRLEAAEPQHHLVACPELVIVDDEQDFGLL